jgi:hypothetical protein
MLHAIRRVRPAAITSPTVAEGVKQKAPGSLVS